MIYGETTQDRLRRERREFEEKYVKPRIVFAWKPVRLRDGRRAWLQRVHRTFWFRGSITGTAYFYYDLIEEKP